MAKRQWSGLHVASAVLLCGLLALPAFADSQARIVRLSDIQGDVQIDRRDGDGAQQALLNMPVVEGMRLWTGDDGRAEVEFEDGSTLRLVPNSTVQFSRLYLRDNGGKVTNVELEEGTTYFNIDLGKRDDFTIDFGRRTLTLERSARFRVNVDRSEAHVAVSQGGVELSAASGVVEVKKNHTVTLDLQDTDRNEIASAYNDEPYDEWDQQQDSYHSLNMRNAQYDVSTPYSYGFSDLNYYGNYVSCPGFGMLWQPYGISSGWDPFMDGSWVWYPGWGYTWVSAYPWGWMPYRYGSWAYAPGCGGWGWQPGYWTTWYPVPQVVQQPPQWRKPRPPVTGRTPVVVTGGTAVVGPAHPVRGPIRAIGDSYGEAGLGVRRGELDLSKLRRGRDDDHRPVTRDGAKPIGSGIEASPGTSSKRPDTGTGTKTVITDDDQPTAGPPQAQPKPQPGPDVRPARGMPDADGPARVVPRGGGSGRGGGYRPVTPSATPRPSAPASAPSQHQSAPAPRPSAPSSGPSEHRSSPPPAPSPHVSTPHSGNSHRSR